MASTKNPNHKKENENVSTVIVPKGSSDVSNETISIETVKAGDATHYPKEGDTIRIHYEGFYEDGKTMFDSSKKRGQPFYFRLGRKQVIQGFDLTVGKMSIGQIVRIRLSPSHAYGERGFPPIIPPNATLLFTIELLDFTDQI